MNNAVTKSVDEETSVMPIYDAWASSAVVDCGLPFSPAIKAGPFGSSLTKDSYSATGYKVYGQEQVIREDATFGDYFIDRKKYNELKSCSVQAGDILMSLVGTAGRVLIVPEGAQPGVINPRLIRIRTDPTRVSPAFLSHVLRSDTTQAKLESLAQGGTMGVLNATTVGSIIVPVPSIAEQHAISESLSVAHQLVESLERLIAKKQAIKQGMMQQLLTGETRLSGFSSPWEALALADIALILDNLRMPLSAEQRRDRNGPFPYCGANGVLDHIDEYMIDDDVILLAEDGGNFDQFYTRPIAYRMQGKMWVNNHAHVLKAAPGHDTGFLFYALERKDITPFISSGTRSKLTRGELVKIELVAPTDITEQRAIADLLSNAYSELNVLNLRLCKVRDLKQGMIQELLTGRTRLTPSEVAA